MGSQDEHIDGWKYRIKMVLAHRVDAVSAAGKGFKTDGTAKEAPRVQAEGHGKCE